ncbi:cache domain containing protein [Echinococcus multilocularis]|uniref:Cache domain containing protein n=1 Tax=Echinococcus multilocularis TaxID=6211 RepID=A0A068YN10_ECHMU|nr:cache domain containing protein [Echinococcus multilocularis]
MGCCKIILVLLTGVVFFCNCYANSRVYVSSGNLTNRAGNGNEVISFASILGNEFTKLARDELGTMTMQAAFDRLEYEPKPENSAKWDLDSLVDQLSLRLRHYGHLVSNPQALVVQLHREHNRSPISPRFDCCNLSERDLRYEALYGARVSRRKCCDLIPFNLPVAAFNPGHNLTQRFRRQLEYWPNVKWLYFITAAGLHTEFPAHNFRAATVTSALVESLAAAAAAAAASAPSSPPPSPSIQSLLPTLRNWGWPTVEVKQRAGRHLPPSLFTALYDCRSVHQLRHREVFVRSVVAQPIWLVLVLDQSEASKTRMLLGQRIARQLLASLSEKDRVALVLASDTARVATVGAATSDTTAIHLLPATHETKLFLIEHVYSLRGPGVAKTNHTRALLEAFGILHDAVEAQKHDISESAGLGLPTDNLMIAYISRGSLDDLQEQNATLQQVTEQQARLGNRVVINTYMPVEEKSATVLFEKTFMSDLAKRWNAHSNPEGCRSSDVRPGHFYTINRTADLVETVGRFYEVWLKRSGQEASERDERTPNTTATTTVPSSKLSFSLPYKDLEGKGLVMSISQAFYDGDTFLGIMGVDLHVADLLDQIIYYGGTPASNFVFLLDASSSLSVYHPGGLRDLLTTPPAATSDSSAARSRRSSISASREEAFQRSFTFQEPLLHVDVRYLERTPGFDNLILPRILRGEVNGTVDFLVAIDSESFARIETTGVWSERVGSLLSSSIPSPRLNGDRMKEVKITYRWRRITDPDTQFVLVMRSMQQVNVPPPRQLVEITPPFDSWYHRLDLFKRDQACLYLRQLATFSSTTVYLPPRTFMRPFEHLASYSVSSEAGGGTERRGETAEEVRHLVAYLTDQTALISNPGLRVSPSTGTYATASAPDARTAVAVVERIGKFWRQRGAAVSGISTFGKHIIRRYVSTDTGVMLMYPGTLMPQSFDATTRPWYLRAVENAGRIVFTEPYLDHGGAGHIVTIAFAIFEGNRSGVHNPRTDRVQSVMAMDVPYRLFNHLLSTWLPSHCNFEPPYLRHKSTLKEKAKLKKSGTKWKGAASKASRIPLSPNSSPQKEFSRAFLDFLRDYGVRVEPSAVPTEGVESEVKEENEVETEEVNELNIVGKKTSTKCFLMNDRGYLIAHHGYAEPLQINRALESSHISHREPSIAADLLNHGEFVHKVACVSHSQRALERYYVYNTSYEGVVTNSAPGDHCTRYRFALVPGTNLFLGLVHEAPQAHQRIRRSDEVTTTSGGDSCSPRAAFCACSTKDRRCLNCGRLEPLECECPCQCPLSTFTGPPFISASTSAAVSPLDNHPACLALSLDVPLLPTTKAAAAASWKALARLPDAPPLCQPSNSLSIRVPVASLREWLSILLPSFASSANVSSPKSESGIVADGGPLVPAVGPTDCASLNRRATECTASIGCEFCLLGADVEPLSSGGFCAPMGVCFGGVVGSASPYSSPISSSSTTTFATSNGASPVDFLEDRWPLVPPLPPPPLPPPPLQLPPLGAQLAPLNGYYHYRNLLPKSDSHAIAAAHFYHYYYYYHYYHQQQQQQLLHHRGDDDFYASPYVLAGHYMGGGGRSEAELGASAGLMVWTNSPVGPVAGAVLAVFIVLLLGVYCLRHQAANRVRQSATATAVGNVGECASTGLLVGSGGGEATEGDASNQSACSRNHSGEKVCCCERPPESDTDKDKPPPTAGAVALLVKATSASSAASGADDHSISGCGGSNAGTDTESERGPPRCCASSPSPFAPSAAAIIIEGVGVFVKSNAFSNEELAQVPEEPKSLPLAEFVTDPTAISPYRVTTGDAVTVATTADASTPADDQVTTVSSSAATTTDHGYVSNDRPSSSYAESSSLADSVVPGPTAASAGGAITVAEVIDDGEGEKEARSILGEPEMASAPGRDSSTAISGAWIGTLILGPGMDEVMCAEELEHQFLFSSKRGSNMQQSQPLHNSQRGRLLPSWRKAYQHYRHLHHQYQHQYYQLQHHTCHPSHQHHQAGVGRSGGGLTRFPVLIQSPPPPSSTPTSPSPLSSPSPPTTSAHWGEPSEENIV